MADLSIRGAGRAAWLRRSAPQAGIKERLRQLRLRPEDTAGIFRRQQASALPASRSGGRYRCRSGSGGRLYDPDAPLCVFSADAPAGLQPVIVQIGTDQVDHHRRAVYHRRRRQIGNRPQMRSNWLMEAPFARPVAAVVRAASSSISRPSAVTKHSIAITPTSPACMIADSICSAYAAGGHWPAEGDAGA